jgi:ATP-dependent DNA helicase RecG
MFIFDDRVEFINPGALLNQLTLDSIRIGGISQRRNPVICSLTARLGRRELYGLGIPQMIRIVRERGLPEPEFSVEGGHFRVVLRREPARTA